jgi:sugar/nucleoside kinase (ribokinase family)
MGKKKYDVAGIGSPLLDFIVEVDEGTLAEVDLNKGEMHLIDANQSKEILKKLEHHRVKTAPGGSSANTLAGVAALGGSAVFLGKIGDDYHGTIYEQKMIEDGVDALLSRHDAEQTGHAITFITPDSERTFATHLGAAMHFRKDDVFDDSIRESEILHIEGYQLEDPALVETVIHAMEVAKESDGMISIDLADPALIGRHLEPITDLVLKYADIVFVNELEAKAFTGKEELEALHHIYDMCEIAIVKLGEEGSLLKADDTYHIIPAYAVDVDNTNGAGDAYAAGILFSIARGIDMERAGKIASYIAAQVVASPGARVERSLKEEIEKL